MPQVGHDGVDPGFPGRQNLGLEPGSFRYRATAGRNDPPGSFATKNRSYPGAFRQHPRLVQGVGGGNVQRLRLLREALEVELGSEEMHVQSRVLLEAETELEALEASAHDS